MFRRTRCGHQHSAGKFALLIAACLNAGHADAEELRFASWPEVIVSIPCNRIGRDAAGSLVVLGPFYTEETHFLARAITRPFEAKEISDRCFNRGGARRAYRPYYPYRNGEFSYYSPGPFLLSEQ